MNDERQDILPPEQNIVRMLFGTLFGTEVTVKPRSANEMHGPTGPFVAAYGNGRPTPLGIVMFDMRMAAITSSALSRIPPGTTEDAIKAGALNEMMRENFAEIMNLSSRLLGRRHGPRVRFEYAWDNPAVASEKVQEIIRSPRLRDDWEVSIPGYGSGGIAIMTPQVGTANL